MNKTGLIISREYLTRVRKKSFIIITILGPLLFAAFLILPTWIAQMEDQSITRIAVVETSAYGDPLPDSLQFFRGVIPDRENLKFDYLTSMGLEEMLKTYEATDYDGILYLPQSLISAGNRTVVEFYYRKLPSVSVESYISGSLENYLFNNKLVVQNVPASLIQSLETNVSLNRINWENWPEMVEDATDLKRGLGFVVGLLIYFFIFFFGAQIMRGVLEEKTSRIVEVIVSSVTPFQLMLGKIIGIGLTGLTQFLVWLILTFGITAVAQQFIMPNPADVTTEQIAPTSIMEDNALQQVPEHPGISNNSASGMMSGIFRQLGQINIAYVIIAFVFYFLGGYLLYGSLFAAIGAASDNDTDTQQFMLPITIPLILGMFVMINASMNPSSQLAIIFSMIPFTSPIVMMARIPFDIPFIEVLVSAVILILTFMGTTWMAGKIYRTGILMYGKKVTYGELWKWIRYKA
ncbi:MAG: ABC transporter permease [Bacteroidales bacterium]|nr:ABC transporter permease [Bacteroidales bacterium]